MLSILHRTLEDLPELIQLVIGEFLRDMHLDAIVGNGIFIGVRLPERGKIVVLVEHHFLEFFLNIVLCDFEPFPLDDVNETLEKVLYDKEHDPLKIENNPHFRYLIDGCPLYVRI